MLINSQTLLAKKEILIKQIDDTFLIVDKKEVLHKLGMSKQLMDYHLHKTKSHARNIDVLERIVNVQQEILKRQDARINTLIEPLKK